MRIYLFKDVAILAGCGVGGGSLVYANTLYVPSPANPGVNPSLTITALAEHAMTFIPGTDGSAESGDGEVLRAKDRPGREPAQHEVGEP